MEEKDFFKKMENLKKPEVSAEVLRSQMKLAIMNTKKSATWGIWFLAIPIFFFGCVTIKELFQWNWNVADNFTDWMGWLDKKASLKWVTPVFLVLLPAIGALINLLAIMHFIYDKASSEFIITIKLKWLNIMLAVVSISIVGFVFLYGIMETAAERAIHRIEKVEQQKAK